MRVIFAVLYLTLCSNVYAENPCVELTKNFKDDGNLGGINFSMSDNAMVPKFKTEKQAIIWAIQYFDTRHVDSVRHRYAKLKRPLDNIALEVVDSEEIPKDKLRIITEGWDNVRVGWNQDIHTLKYGIRASVDPELEQIVQERWDVLTERQATTHWKHSDDVDKFTFMKKKKTKKLLSLFFPKGDNAMNGAFVCSGSMPVLRK